MCKSCVYRRVRVSEKEKVCAQKDVCNKACGLCILPFITDLEIARN